MTIDGAVVPGLLFLFAELVALAGVGYVVVRVALRETDDRVALAQGLVVGPAIWGVVVNLVMYAIPGMPGAVAGWVFVLALAAVLIWRAPKPVRPRLRTAAGFALIALALFWVVLASRQTWIRDTVIHLGLSASIRAGGFPPELPWNPGTPAPYHYGVDLLVGVLAPPIGPDLPFVTELMGAYAWMSLSLVVATALLRRASAFVVLAVAPLMLTAAAWSLWNGEPASVVEATVPTGIPSAGLRASLMDIYWRAEQSHYFSVLANVSRPAFTLPYALTFVVLARAACAGRRSWPATLTLAALIGFMGIASSTLAPIALVLWAGLEAVWLIESRRAGSVQRSDVIRSVSGLTLAAMLLLAGSFSSFILGGSVTSGLSLGTNERFGGWRLLGALDRLPGGVGLLGLGPLAVVGAAVLLARRDRLVQALAAGTGILLLASLLLNYEPFPFDLVRLEGHARNFALFALLLALGSRLAGLRSVRWRYATGAAIVALVTWPTIIAPVRNLGLVIGNGIDLANAQQTPGKRYVLEHLPSDRVAAYIRNNTAVDARVFSPHPNSMTFATGRPNASGFAGLVHLQSKEGPAYRDVVRFLEAAAVRRLGIAYIHAPDAWVEGLPDEAAARLNDSRLFELLVRDESESLYRVLPAFLTLDAPPAPGSYEALRQAVPASTTVFLSAISDSSPLAHTAQPLLSSGAVRARRLVVVRTARALSHARLLGAIDPETLQLRTPWRAEPLDDHVPDLVIVPLDFTPWMFPPASRQPIWWNDETAVYTLDGAVDPIMPSPSWTEPLPFTVWVSDVSEADGRIAFTATFDDRAPDQWSGQDWIVTATETPPWDIPTQLLADGVTPPAQLWFSGQTWPGRKTTAITYQVDFLAPSMAFRDSAGAWTPAGASESESGPGAYVLAVRLRHEYKPNQWRAVAYIPVLKITVSETGEVSYQVHEEAGGEPGQ